MILSAESLHRGLNARLLHALLATVRGQHVRIRQFLPNIFDLVAE